MAAINVPGYGDIVPLSEGAEALVKSEDPEHVSKDHNNKSAGADVVMLMIL